MQREVIRPAVDIPITFKLDKGPEGTPKAGKGGLQYQYVVNDDSAIMWLDPAARDAIIRSGAISGQSVQLVKTQNGKATFFYASIAGESAYATAPTPPPAPAPPPYVQPLPRTDSNGRAIPAPPPVEAPRGIRLVAPVPANGYAANGNAYQNGAAPAPSAQASAPAPEAEAPKIPLMTRAMYSAIDTLMAARAYASKRGLDYNDEINVEDIRTIAITLYIGFQKGNN